MIFVTMLMMLRFRVSLRQRLSAIKVELELEFIEGHPLTAKVPDRGSFLAFLEIFSHLMLTILHGNY